MTITHLISLASKPARLQFLAMERSLRATGCKLPLRVIPFGNDLFELPAGSSWWPSKPLAEWIAREAAHPMMIKYQALTAGQCAYFDADICFLRDPAEALAPYSGFVVSDTEWNRLSGTHTDESRSIMERSSSVWQKNIFNAGHWATDTPPYDEQLLMVTARKYSATCLQFPEHDQPGTNLLVHLAGVQFLNLTLHPHNMESSWVGDYRTADYEKLWHDPMKKPYFMHWAGNWYSRNYPINDVFYNYLTHEERMEWDESQRQYLRHKEAQSLQQLTPLWREGLRRTRRRIRLWRNR